MVDRLEELLALMEDEDDEDERQDALEMVREAAPVPAAPTAENEAEDVPGDGADQADLRLDEDAGLSWTLDVETAPSEGQEKKPDVETAPSEGQEKKPDVKTAPSEGQEKKPGVNNGAVENGTDGNEATELLWDELAAPVTGPGGSVVLRRPGSGDVELAELVGVPGQSDAAADSVRPADGGLEGLYRQALQASRPAVQGLPVEQAGRSMRAEEPGRTAALTMDELDRAVRRDSRRYDGGMTIY